MKEVKKCSISGVAFTMDADAYEEARNLVMQDLRAHFRPEFLNRLDETIMFKPLTDRKSVV